MRKTVRSCLIASMLVPLLLLGCGREKVLYTTTSADGEYRADIVTWYSAIGGTHEAQLRLFSGEPPAEVGRLEILSGRDEAEDISNEIRGIRWSRGTLEIEVARHHLRFPEGIVALESEHAGGR